MKKINLKDFELLGCDYKRGTEVYLDNKTGDLYVRRVSTISIPAKTPSGKDYNRVSIADSVVFKVAEGEVFSDSSNVLSRDN